jgi:hypothetical protein
VNRLYQWLSGRASFFRADTSRGTGRTVRTEVTVERQSTTMLVAGATAVGFDTCPLCGSRLAPDQAEQPSGRLLKGSISQGPGPVDGPSPGVQRGSEEIFAGDANQDGKAQIFTNE